MSRSTKKGPYVDPVLLQRVKEQKVQGKKGPLKTYNRACMIPPEFVGHTFMVHQGKDFKEVFVNESMVGHRLGEFALTRKFRGHGRMVKRVVTKT